MPSKGSPIVSCRISQVLLQRVKEQLEMSAIWRRAEPWTLATFVEAAIREKLHKMKRSRRPRRKKGVNTSPAWCIQ
jgi:hypothetical protein